MSVRADPDGPGSHERRENLEAALRTAALRGDLAAWRCLYDRGSASLDAHVRHLTAGNHDLADEVIQETWMVAVRRLKSFEPQRAAFATWLRGIAKHTLRGVRRKRSGSTSPLCAETALAGSTRDSEESSLLAARVRAALLRLPRAHRMVLRAKYLDQLSVAEIAAASGTTQKSVESLLSRARTTFRSIFRRENDS